jgi:putative nucleotidyltransferase with HDIG domain
MKSFDALTQQLEGWRRHCDRYWHQLTPRALPSARKPAQRRSLQIPGPVMLAIAIVSLTSVVGYRFYNQPRLKEGIVAPKTLIANDNIRFEDTQSTEAKRKQAQTGLFPILKVDPTANFQTEEKLEAFLSDVQQLRQQVGPFPYINERILSLPVQHFLRSSADEEWQYVVAAINPQNYGAFANGDGSSAALQSSPRLPEIRDAIAGLRRYQAQAGPTELAILLEQIAQERRNYQGALNLIDSFATSDIAASYKISLLALSDTTWQETRQGLELAVNRILAQGIPRGLPEDIKRTALQVQLKRQVAPQQEEKLAEVLLKIVQPNLVDDPERTAERAQQARAEVEAVIVEIKKGEAIVKAGEPISQRQFLILDRLDLSDRGINWAGLAVSGGLVTLSIGVFWLVQQRLSLRLRCRDRILLCLLSVSTPLLTVLNVPYVNLPAVGLLVSSFYSPTLAVTQVALLSGLTSFSAVTAEGGMLIGWDSLIPGVMGGFVAAVTAGRLRSREELALLGGAVGAVSGSVNLVVNLIVSSTPGAVWLFSVPEAALYGLWGTAWCVVALGLSPYLEKLFDLITPIRLAELSNPNRPLLKRLATEAPGTFQHTLFVASLAEAAARELHCNVELARAGTLYHDIGKMHDPLGFIENQMGGPNKHDEIDDPWRSAEIIKKHVSQGLVMARKYNLPQAICNFIPEHQGTILISYFYFQAQQRAQAERRMLPPDESQAACVPESEFRYDGPIPQSRETGIVMLADACEAALRSLKDVTPEVALATIKKIFKARWQDHQLVDSGLKQEELPIIADVFVRVWQQYNHQRIAYPKAALEPQPSAK